MGVVAWLKFTVNGEYTNSIKVRIRILKEMRINHNTVCKKLLYLAVQTKKMTTDLSLLLQDQSLD